MRLQIITEQSGLTEEFHISKLQANSLSGGLEILKGHAPLISALAENSQVRFCLEENTAQKQELTFSKALLVVKQENKQTVLKILAQKQL